jgi:hypothetical protein
MDTKDPVDPDDSPHGFLRGWFIYTLDVADRLVEVRQYQPGGRVEQSLQDELTRAGENLAECLGEVLGSTGKKRRRRLRSDAGVPKWGPHGSGG